MLRRAPWLDILLVLALAAFTVNRYAPSAFSGDVILYSVMSLQNVTLFFWEQNRLLNVGPAIASLLRDPELNFFVNLLFPAMVFFTLLRYWAGQVAERGASAVPDGCTLDGRGVFLVLVLAVFTVLRPVAIFDYVIWHVEYSLAWMLLAVAYFHWFELNVEHSRYSPTDARALGPRLSTPLWRYFPRWREALVMAALMVVATGVNYSIVLPAMALAFGRVWIVRRLDREPLIFAAVAVGTLVSWTLVARYFPGPGQGMYAGFEVFGLASAIPTVLRNMGAVVSLPGLGIVVGVVLALRFAGRRSERMAETARTVRWLLVSFALIWLVYFAGNTWVAANHYHFRYFAPILFVCVMLLAMELVQVRIPLSATARLLAGLAILLGLLAHLLRPFVPLHDYDFVRRANAVAVDGVTLHGGEFNLAWASVMRGMLHGEPALGIAERALGNEAELHKHAAAALAADGVLRVNCVGAEVTRCLDQANAHVGPLRLRDVAFEGDAPGHSVLTLEPGSPAPLVYQGAALLALQGEVGQRGNDGVRVSGARGFLVYGPYRPMSVGAYRLRVFGAGAHVDGAWVDVVSQGARRQHVRLPLSAVVGEAEGVLAEGMLRFDAPVRDLEVRVFVTESDKLVLTGYELMPDAMDMK